MDVFAMYWRMTGDEIASSSGFKAVEWAVGEGDGDIPSILSARRHRLVTFVLTCRLKSVY